MQLKEALINNKPRENSGSSSSNRFQYQKDWALCKLLELQLEKNNYVIIFDFHDDILVIDSDVEPTKMDFYQIKTKNKGNWSFKNLSKEDTKKEQSILGKMLYNKLLFLQETRSMEFVSNALYNLELENPKDDSKNFNNIHLNLISKEKQKALSKNLIKEFAQDYIDAEIKTRFTEAQVDELLNITYLRVSELGITGHDTYTIGKVSETLDKIDSSNRVNATVAYKMLATEISKKNDYEWKLQSFEEIITYKGISRSQFSELLRKLIKESKNYDLWKNVEQNLQINGLGIKKIKSLKNYWQQYELEKMDGSNNYLKKIQEDINIIIDEVEDDSSYLVLMNKTFNKYIKRHGNNDIYEEDYLKAIILTEIANG